MAGVITAADINGVLNISGGADLFGLFTSYTGDKIDPSSGSAFLIGGNVTQGVIIQAGALVMI